LASPVPPLPARAEPSASQIEIGFMPPVKYGPTGEAITRYSARCAERTPKKFSAAISNGRM
jgi:hypothetical protein